MSECFAMHGILLVSVGEGDILHPGLHIIQRTFSCRSMLDSWVTEGCVSEVEGLALTPFRGRGEGIFIRIA